MHLLFDVGLILLGFYNASGNGVYGWSIHFVWLRLVFLGNKWSWVRLRLYFLLRGNLWLLSSDILSNLNFAEVILCGDLLYLWYGLWKIRLKSTLYKSIEGWLYLWLRCNFLFFYFFNFCWLWFLLFGYWLRNESWSWIWCWPLSRLLVELRVILFNFFSFLFLRWIVFLVGVLYFYLWRLLPAAFFLFLNEFELSSWRLLST